MGSRATIDSPFFEAGSTTTAGTLTLLPHRRDLVQSTVLSANKDAVCNTRFGNYPHSTLLGIPWGSQVLASKLVQENQKRSGRKRKVDELGDTIKAEEEGLLIAGTASSGFTHVLPPTPELWTQSLPHRTQVVYTPDYSFVLQRLKVRPGSVIIEAGAGSGSFTHAAARAVYNGPELEGGSGSGHNKDGRTKGSRLESRRGRVFSFEYHEPRAKQLTEEIRSHGLESVVTVTHRDVYEHGFNLMQTESDDNLDTIKPINATAIFLDLPAPWLALKHLTRNPVGSVSTAFNSNPTSDSKSTSCSPFVSPLSKCATIHICTFSPCIEQVSKTVSTLRELGWVDVEVVELAQRRLDVRRVRYGTAEEGSRDGHPVPASVEEAVERLKDVKTTEEQNRMAMKERELEIEKDLGISRNEAKEEVAKALRKKTVEARDARGGRWAKVQRLEEFRREREGRKTWTEGNIVMRTEPEIRCHTSYLVFAIRPRTWTMEDESLATKQIGTLNNERQKRTGGTRLHC